MSEMTVSRVLRNRGDVSAATREKVLTAAKTLGYVPNKIAGGLASQRVNLVAVVIPSLSNLVFPDVLGGISAELDDTGLQPVIGVTNYSPAREEMVLYDMLSWRPSGVILAGLEHSKASCAMLGNAGIPVVEIMDIDGEGIDTLVGISHIRAGREMAARIIAAGYRRIGFVGTHMPEDHRARKRLVGFEECLAEAGLHLEAREYYQGGSSLLKGRELTQRILTRAPDLDFLYFSNDMIGAGAAALSGQGLRHFGPDRSGGVQWCRSAGRAAGAADHHRRPPGRDRAPRGADRGGQGHHAPGPDRRVAADLHRRRDDPRDQALIQVACGGRALRICLPDAYSLYEIRAACGGHPPARHHWRNGAGRAVRCRAGPGDRTGLPPRQARGRRAGDQLARRLSGSVFADCGADQAAGGETGVPVHAFVEDVAASGGYWLACAADHIWADESSILGSIGVISAGFGFHDLISRWGIERRVHTAGRSKSTLDPFRPEKPEDIERLRGILEPIHGAFKDHVTARRGNRLAEGRDLFTGEFWAGRQAVELGLADGIAHLVPKMKALHGDKTRFAVYGVRQPWLRRIGLSADLLLDAAEERAAFSRFGAGG